MDKLGVLLSWASLALAFVSSITACVAFVTVLRQRNSLYQKHHKDFADQQDRVRKELQKDH